MTNAATETEGSHTVSVRA